MSNEQARKESIYELKANLLNVKRLLANIGNQAFADDDLSLTKKTETGRMLIATIYDIFDEHLEKKDG